jgi:hypothetical protein
MCLDKTQAKAKSTFYVYKVSMTILMDYMQVGDKERVLPQDWIKENA